MKFVLFLTILVVVLVASTTAIRVGVCPQASFPVTCIGPRNVGTSCARTPPRRMWYYDSATNTCIAMEYMGSGGNSNRWCYVHDCQRKCVRARMG